MKIKVEEVNERLMNHILGFESYVDLAQEVKNEMFGVNRVTEAKMTQEARETMKYWEGYIAGVQVCKNDIEELKKRFDSEIGIHKAKKEWKKNLKKEWKDSKRKKV